MKVFRIVDQKYHEDLSGKGASLFGGRWNRINQAVLYTSSSISLACLELLVNVDLSFKSPELSLMHIEIPDRLDHKVIHTKALPKTWRSTKGYKASREIASTWFFEAQTAVLDVPSAVIPQERNFIINVNHPYAKKVKLLLSEPFTFDARLLK